MAEETETIEETVEKEVTYYKCDKCHGRFHDETQFKEDLNKVVFGAKAKYSYTIPANTQDAHSSGSSLGRGTTITGEHEYLLCDRCMEDAYEYLRDFF